MATSFKQHDTYVVELDDVEWYTADEEKRKILEVQYREMARRQACSMVQVYVIPDPLFAMCEEKKRHRVYMHRFPATDKPYSVAATFAGEIDREIYFKATEFERGILVRQVRDDLNKLANGVPGKYFINLTDGTLLEKGRV